MPSALMRLWLFFTFGITIVAGTVQPAQAEQVTTVSQPYQQRAAELLQILQGSELEREFFADSFIAAVPVVQFRTLLGQLNAQYGDPLSISQIIPASPYDGTVEIRYRRATLAMRMVLADSAPHAVVGLLVTGAQVADDSIAKITAEMAALPGTAGFEIADITAADPAVIARLNSDRQFAIGSTFKLYVLAALSRKIATSGREWGDVLRLYRKSLPSGILQDWPRDTPMTTQSLATLMITVSDNSATDILMTELGSRIIEQIVVESGHGAPDKTIPMLNTLQFFALKMPENADIRERYIAADNAEQDEILYRENSRLDLDNVRISNLANKPQHIETIEWFASPSDITGLLHLLKKRDDPVVHSIIRVNGMIPPGDRLRWRHIGGKGGSEPGVISFAFLAEAKSGKTFAVSGSWNNPDAPVDEPKFLSLMNRVLNIVAER